jgi:hypothetical protein
MDVRADQDFPAFGAIAKAGGAVHRIADEV